MYLIKVYMDLDVNFVKNVNALKKDTVNLIKLFSGITSDAAGTVNYQSVLPRFITKSVVDVLSGKKIKTEEERAESAVIDAPSAEEV